MATKAKEAFLNVRVTEKIRSQFHAKARKYSTPSTVLRELITAFVQDRVTVQPPVNHITKKDLYVNIQ